MNYIKQPEGIYPYPLIRLRRDNPNISFPSDLTLLSLGDFGVFSVEDSIRPSYDSTTQILEEITPVIVDGVYKRQWSVRNLTAEELHDKVPKTVTKLQGMLAIAEVGLANDFINWKNSLDPIADFAALAFLESAQTWEYDNELLNAVLETFNLLEQKDFLFTLAKSL